MHFIICDDHPIVGAALGMMLQNTFNAEVHLFPDFRRARALAAAMPLVDLWVLDINIPGEKLACNLAGVRALGCAPVILFSGTEDEADRRMALDAGIEGFLPKSATPEVIEAAVRFVLAGGRYIPDLQRHPNEVRGAEAQPGQAAAVGVMRLTDRQRAVLAYLAQGESNKEIGRSLGISPATVKAHLAQIFALMGVANRTEAALLASREGLIE